MDDDSDAQTVALGEALYWEAKKRGWTLKTLAKELGTNPTTLGRYLTRHERGMPAWVLTRGSRVIGVPLRDLVTIADASLEEEGRRAETRNTSAG